MENFIQVINTFSHPSGIVCWKVLLHGFHLHTLILYLKLWVFFCSKYSNWWISKSELSDCVVPIKTLGPCLQVQTSVTSRCSGKWIFKAEMWQSIWAFQESSIYLTGSGWKFWFNFIIFRNDQDLWASAFKKELLENTCLHPYLLLT